MLLLPLLIADITDADERSFIIEVYNKSYKRMYQIAMFYSNDLEDADDIVSEITMVLMKKIEYLRKLDEHVLYPYVYGIAKHVGMDSRRRAKRRVHVDKDPDELPSRDHFAEPDARILESVNIAELTNAISKLSATDQFVLEARYFMEYSDRDIARILGIKPVSVRSRLTRARKALYRIMKEDN